MLSIHNNLSASAQNATGAYLEVHDVIKYTRKHHATVTNYAKQKHLGCKKVQGQSEATCKQAVDIQGVKSFLIK